MAHWAKIDENNKVVHIIKINDADYDDEGHAWIKHKIKQLRDGSVPGGHRSKGDGGRG